MQINQIEVQRTVGSGPESVYAYSFPSLIKGTSWPIKIGRSSKCAFERIFQQQASMIEPPIVGLLIRTDNSKFLERSIHLALSDRKMPTYGNEWFLTNPPEIEEAVMKQEHHRPTLGDLLRLARHERRLGQVALAEKAGLRQATISAIEKGKDVRLSSIEALCRALGTRLVMIDDEDAL